MLDKKEMTALVPSVGADERQPSQKVCKNSIPASDKEIRYENKAKHAGRQVVLTFTPTGESKNKS